MLASECFGEQKYTQFVLNKHFYRKIKQIILSTELKPFNQLNINYIYMYLFQTNWIPWFNCLKQRDCSFQINGI
ncbi:MAG TPA: hypothetical protein DCF33_09165 [Saprospirales bacterium]|nr:hypothetical protein [Saprospirales bacterium]